MKFLKKIFSVCLVLAVTFMFAGCGGNTGGKSDSSSAKAETKKKYVSIIAGSSGAAWYIVGGGLANVISKYVNDVEVTVEPGGGAENIIRVSDGEVTLGMTMSDNLYYAKEGKREYKDKYDNIRVVISGHDNPMKLFVRADSGINTLADIKGKTVGMGHPGSSQALAANAMLITCGLTPDKDFKALWLTPTEISEALQDKTIDAGFNYTADPSGAMTDLTRNVDVRFIELDVDKILAEHPYWYRTSLPAGTYKGMDKEYVTVGANVILVARKDTDAQLVYDVTKALLSHPAEIAQVHRAGSEWITANVSRGVTVDFHEGALKYFKEAGINADVKKVN
jgi:TRAP transporter TAXI family solute receptor